MDVVALGLAKADAARKYSSPGHFAGLMSRLQAGNEDAVWAILGDSTGNETTEWVYLTAQWLAGQFPAVTVLYRLWNDTNQNYDAATTVQTGTGSRTLTIYNGSTSGQNAAYSVTRIALQIPVTPHAITVSYGHNEGSTNGAGYRPLLYALTRQLEDWFPTASLIVTAQNPRAATDANYSLDLSRAQATIELAATEGYGLVNATQAFLNTANYATTLLIGDGLHPNGAGSALWASLVQQQMTRSLLVTPRAMQSRPHRVFLPATQFVVSEGAPTLAAAGAANTQFPAWAMDPTTQGGLVASFDIPDSWLSITAYVVWHPPTGSGYTGSNNGVRWSVGLSRLSTAAGIPFSSPAASAGLGAMVAYSDVIVTSGASNSGTYSMHVVRVASGTQFGSTTSGRPLSLRVRRVAADAADTLAEIAYFRGVIIERAS
jgi:lysophospholipase L1-like esterase